MKVLVIGMLIIMLILAGCTQQSVSDAEMDIENIEQDIVPEVDEDTLFASIEEQGISDDSDSIELGELI